MLYTGTYNLDKQISCLIVPTETVLATRNDSLNIKNINSKYYKQYIIKIAKLLHFFQSLSTRS